MAPGWGIVIRRPPGPDRYIFAKGGIRQAAIRVWIFRLSCNGQGEAVRGQNYYNSSATGVHVWAPNPMGARQFYLGFKKGPGIVSCDRVCRRLRGGLSSRRSWPKGSAIVMGESRGIQVRSAKTTSNALEIRRLHSPAAAPTGTVWSKSICALPEQTSARAAGLSTRMSPLQRRA